LSYKESNSLSGSIFHEVAPSDFDDSSGVGFVTDERFYIFHKTDYSFLFFGVELRIFYRFPLSGFDSDSDVVSIREIGVSKVILIWRLKPVCF
jgi:hypothetical protein